MRQTEKIVLSDGILRARDLERQGISRQQILRLKQRGELIQAGRGLYLLPDATITENHTLAQVCARVPQSVVCLSSALQFHNLTTQNPWQVWLLIERHARAPKIDYPPVRIFRAGGESFTEGVDSCEIEGINVRVTCVAKTVVDCFKYRGKIGLDIALEALRECLQYKRCTPDKILHFAKIGRVANVIRPYMKAMLA